MPWSSSEPGFQGLEHKIACTHVKQQPRENMSDCGVLDYFATCSGAKYWEVPEKVDLA
jgi:hypothetical protein